MMELQKVKDILLGRTLTVRDIKIDKAYDYVITDIEVDDDGYTISCNSGIVGWFLNDKQMEELCEKITCSDEMFEYSIKDTQTGCSDESVIDWEERTWELACDLYLLDREGSFDACLFEHVTREARLFVEKYKNFMEEEL